MNGNWWGMLLVLGVAAAIIGISYLRKKRTEPFLDGFAIAYCEAADHVLGGARQFESTWLATETTVDGLFQIAPMEQQPEALRDLFQKGVDEYALDRLRTMYVQRQRAQETLSGINMLSKRVNPVLNSTYDLLNESLSLIHTPGVTFDQKSLDRFHYFLHKQQHVRNVGLASVISEKCKQEIAC